MLQTKDINIMHVTGVVAEEPVFTNCKRGDEYFETKIHSERKSGYKDEVIVIFRMTPENRKIMKPGNYVDLKGEFRSYRKHPGGHMKIYMLAHKMSISQRDSRYENDCNYVEITGWLVKQPVLRVTPESNMKITDIILAVHRDKGWSDYMPCIVWHDNAVEAAELNTGEQVKCFGHFQSRIYKKRLENGTVEDCTAYEISLARCSRTGETNINNAG